MRVLFDVHSLLWSSDQPERLSARAREAMSSEANERLLSDVTVWEVAIKASIGKLAFDIALPLYFERQSRRLQLTALPISRSHVLYVRELPLHHRDPFDRLLVAQALIEGLPLISNDYTLDAYGITRIW